MEINTGEDDASAGTKSTEEGGSDLEDMFPRQPLNCNALASVSINSLLENSLSPPPPYSSPRKSISSTSSPHPPSTNPYTTDIYKRNTAFLGPPTGPPSYGTHSTPRGFSVQSDKGSTVACSNNDRTVALRSELDARAIARKERAARLRKEAEMRAKAKLQEEAEMKR